jgi:O-6-methylguanine DNA methyltransferase
MKFMHIQSTWGLFTGYYQGPLLTRISLPLLTQPPTLPLFFLNKGSIEFGDILERWFRGEDISSSAFQLIGTNYQKRCWDYIKSIPRGSTWTYATLASALGNPKAARAVAQACARNPLPLIVPCHRIVGKMDLGGYAFGQVWKKILLNREKLTPP